MWRTLLLRPWRQGSPLHYVEMGANLSLLETLIAYLFCPLLLFTPLRPLLLLHAPRQLLLFALLVQLPTLLRRDSLQAEMGLFAFSGSHSSGGFTGTMRRPGRRHACYPVARSSRCAWAARYGIRLARFPAHHA